MDHEFFMGEALRLAREAMADGDVPVGCVVVKDGQIIGRGRNRREVDGDATAHAEVEAIREACAQLGSWRLQDCAPSTSTGWKARLPPCCGRGAIVNARISEGSATAQREEEGPACWRLGCSKLFEEAVQSPAPRIYQGPLTRRGSVRMGGLFQEFFSKSSIRFKAFCNIHKNL